MNLRGVFIVCGLVGLGLILSGCTIESLLTDLNTGTSGGNQEESAEEGQINEDATTGEETVEPDTSEGGRKMTGYTMEEISRHATAEDCWLLIESKVYDVSQYVSGHPGGKAILEGCGKDATELYNTRPMGSGTAHSEKARLMLDKYLIGELIASEVN